MGAEFLSLGPIVSKPPDLSQLATLPEKTAISFFELRLRPLGKSHIQLSIRDAIQERLRAVGLSRRSTGVYRVKRRKIERDLGSLESALCFRFRFLMFA
jgi:hypothetical protein